MRDRIVKAWFRVRVGYEEYWVIVVGRGSTGECVEA